MSRTVAPPPIARGPIVCPGPHPDGPAAPQPFAPEAGQAPWRDDRGHLDEAQRAWAAHLDAGRIGGRPRPSPAWYAAQAANERAVLGPRRCGGVW